MITLRKPAVDDRAPDVKQFLEAIRQGSISPSADYALKIASKTSAQA